jgi:hypothetical protein
MIWSFSWTEYRVQPDEPNTGIWRPLWDSINLCTPLPTTAPLTRIHVHISDTWGLVGDFAIEIGSEFTFFSSRLRHGPAPTKVTFAEGYAPVLGSESRGEDAYALYTTRTSNDDDIRLESYKPTTLDLSQVGLPEQVDEYKPGAPLAV